MKQTNKTKHTLLPLAAALVCLLAAGCEKKDSFPIYVEPEDDGFPFVMNLHQDGQYYAFQGAWEEGMGAGTYWYSQDSICILGGETLDIFTNKWLFYTVLPVLHNTNLYSRAGDSLFILGERTTLAFVEKSSYSRVNVDSLYSFKENYDSTVGNEDGTIENQSYVLVYYIET